MNVTVSFDIDLEKFRYSLVGNGYILENVVKMTQEDLIAVLKYRINKNISLEYDKSVRYGLLI